MQTAKTFAASGAFEATICAAVTATASMATWQENAATPAVTISVASDMTLPEALTANNVSLVGAASLVKIGNGTVTVDDASGIGSFAGEIHVFQGVWSVGTASGFGTAAGATWVYPNGCVIFTDVTVSRSGEVFHLAGTGKSDSYGYGALRRWLATLPRRCGILASNDRIAAENVEAARAEHLSFPHDFTLVGIDNDEGYSNREGSFISTVRTDDERMGFLAARMAAERSAPVPGQDRPAARRPPQIDARFR